MDLKPTNLRDLAAALLPDWRRSGAAALRLFLLRRCQRRTHTIGLCFPHGRRAAQRVQDATDTRRPFGAAGARAERTPQFETRDEEPFRFLPRRPGGGPPSNH